MNKETIDNKKKALEAEFKKVEELRNQAVDAADKYMQQMLKLQGAYAQLDELENELDPKKDKEKDKE